MSKALYYDLIRIGVHRILRLGPTVGFGLLGHTLFSRFIKGAAWSLIGAIMARGLTFLSMIVAARWLGEETFGELGMVQSTLLLCGGFAGNGVSVSLTKHIAEMQQGDPGRVGRGIGSGLALATALGGVLSLLLLALSIAVGERIFGTSELVGAIQSGTMLVLLIVLTGAQVGSLAGLQKFQAVAVVQVLRSILVSAGLMVGASTGLLATVIGLAVGEAFSLLVNGIVLNRVALSMGISINYRETDFREIRKLWAFAFPVLLSGIIMQPAIWFGNFTLTHQPLGYSKLGVYMAAERWRELLLFIPASLSQTVFAYFSHLRGAKDEDGYAKLFRLNLAAHVVLAAIPACTLLFFPREAMSVFGTGFEGGTITLCMMAVSALPIVVNNLLGQVLQSRGMIWWRFYCDVLLSGTYTILGLLLIPRWQDQGMALGSLLAFIITALVLWVLIRRLMGNRFMMLRFC